MPRPEPRPLKPMMHIPANSLAGVGYHSLGAFLSANCYAPQKFVCRWAWEIFWMVQAAWCWLIWPIVGAALTIPEITAVVSEAPKLVMLQAFFMGMLYGIGGTAFNISIRYIGFSLTYAIAIGLSALTKTVAMPLLHGTLGELLRKDGSGWVVAGVGAGILGIALCGAAGRLKELDFRARSQAGEFSLLKGLFFSLLAGVLAAVYGIAMEDVAKPIVDLAYRHGAGYWRGNIAYPFVNSGAFVTALLYCLYLGLRNRTLGQLTRLAPAGQPAPGESQLSGSGGSLLANYLLAMLTGTLWYGQFFFYNLGHVRMSNAETSWALHMILLVLFSNLVGLVFREWKGCRARTSLTVAAGLATLILSVLAMTYGNCLGEAAGDG